MYYDESNRHDEEKQQLNKIRYFDWTYYYDECNKHNEENKQLNAVLLLLIYSIEYIMLLTRKRTSNL